MIPGLEVSPAVLDELDAQFAGWADHFRRRLSDLGMEGLLREYEVVVRSVESQSCDHGRGQNTGDAWGECCGLSYEYLNDLAARDALEIILKGVPPSATLPWQERIQSLDARLYALYLHQPLQQGSWWHDGLPRGVRD